MIGNLAGALANMFFLSIGLSNNDIICTSAWLFLIINLMKLPIHVFSRETIIMKTHIVCCYAIPVIFSGFWMGHKIVSLIDEKYYRYFLILMTAIGALVIIL